MCLHTSNAVVATYGRCTSNPPLGYVQPLLAIPVFLSQLKAVLKDCPWTSEEDELVIVPQSVSEEYSAEVVSQPVR